MLCCSTLCLQKPTQGWHTWCSGNEWCSWGCSGPHWTFMLLLLHSLGKSLWLLVSLGEEISFPSGFYILILSSQSPLLSFLAWRKALESLLLPWPTLNILKSVCTIAALGASFSKFPLLTPRVSSRSRLIVISEMIDVFWVQSMIKFFSCSNVQLSKLEWFLFMEVCALVNFASFLSSKA